MIYKSCLGSSIYSSTKNLNNLDKHIQSLDAEEKP